MIAVVQHPKSVPLFAYLLFGWMVAFGTALYIVDAALLSVLLPDHAN